MRTSTNILVVDDEKDVRDLLYRVLKKQGYDAKTAENGYKAIEEVKKMPFDIIFMDIKMSGLNGVEAFKIIKEIDPKVSVIMITGYSVLVDELIKGAVKRGIYEVIYKPFNIDKIIKTIEEILRKKKGKGVQSGRKAVSGLSSADDDPEYRR